MSDEREMRNQVFNQGAAQGGIQTTTAADRLKDEFGLVVPVELVKLPSGGKIYPPESGLCNVESLEIKAMTTKEEDILTSRALIKKGTVINELIKSCLIDRSVDVSSMIAGDRNALMVAIRVTGYGAEYDPEVECSACNAKQNYPFDLSKIAINTLDIEPVEPGSNLFAFKLPKCGLEVRFKFMTGKDEEELLHVQERKKKLDLQFGRDTVVSDQLKASLVSVNGITDRAKIGRFVDSMPSFDSQALRTYMSKSQPGIDMSQSMTCASCGETEEVTIPIGINFFWPSAGR